MVLQTNFILNGNIRHTDHLCAHMTTLPPTTITLCLQFVFSGRSRSRLHRHNAPKPSTSTVTSLAFPCLVLASLNTGSKSPPPTIYPALFPLTPSSHCVCFFYLQDSDIYHSSALHFLCVNYSTPFFLFPATSTEGMADWKG